MRLSPSNVAHWRGCRAGGAALRGTREAVRLAARGSRLGARKAGKTRADESSLNAEAVCNSSARRGVAVARRSPACRWSTPRPRRATPELCTSARIATRAAAASVGNV